jgi:hypothetical protein
VQLFQKAPAYAPQAGYSIEQATHRPFQVLKPCLWRLRKFLLEKRNISFALKVWVLRVTATPWRNQTYLIFSSGPFQRHGGTPIEACPSGRYKARGISIVRKYGLNPVSMERLTCLAISLASFLNMRHNLWKIKPTVESEHMEVEQDDDDDPITQRCRYFGNLNH